MQIRIDDVESSSYEDNGLTDAGQAVPTTPNQIRRDVTVSASGARAGQQRVSRLLAGA